MMTEEIIQLEAPDYNLYSEEFGHTQRFFRLFHQMYIAEESKRFAERLHDECLASTQSPIEQLFSMAMLYAISSPVLFNDGTYQNNLGFCFPDNKYVEISKFPVNEPGVRVWPQTSVSQYTADFLIRFTRIGGGYVFGAVECDGHNYHDLTKEQAKHDRQRDRRFQQLGLIVLRYTGSEIWADPLKCALDTLQVLYDRAGAKEARNWNDQLWLK